MADDLDIIEDEIFELVLQLARKVDRFSNK